MISAQPCKLISALSFVILNSHCKVRPQPHLCSSGHHALCWLWWPYNAFRRGASSWSCAQSRVTGWCQVLRCSQVNTTVALFQITVSCLIVSRLHWQLQSKVEFYLKKNLINWIDWTEIVFMSMQDISKFSGILLIKIICQCFANCFYCAGILTGLWLP